MGSVWQRFANVIVGRDGPVAVKLGKDKQKEFHDMKERGAPDRTNQQVKDDARSLFEEAGKEIPKCLQ